MSKKLLLKDPPSRTFKAKFRRSTPKDVHVTETLKGLNRLGRQPRKTMAWLVDFAQRDLSIISEGDRLNLQYEIKAFSTFGPGPTKADGNPFSLGIVDSDPDTNNSRVEPSQLPLRPRCRPVRSHWPQHQARRLRDQVVEFFPIAIDFYVPPLPETPAYTGAQMQRSLHLQAVEVAET